MNKGQLFEMSENLANSRLFSDLAKSGVILDQINAVASPVMKAVGKGIGKKLDKSRHGKQVESSNGEHNKYRDNEPGKRKVKSAYEVLEERK